MKKALLLLLPLLLISCAKDVQEEIVEQTPFVEERPQEIQEAPEEIVYPTMREYVDLFENNIRGHFDFDASKDVPLEDFISIVDEENYYVKLDYSTEEIPLESKELDAAITVFLKNDGSHLIAFQGRLCPRSFFPCSQITDFYTYEKDEEDGEFGLQQVYYMNEPIPHDDLIRFEQDSKDPRAYLGYYLELPRFDATLRLVESGYAFNENCEIDFFDGPRSQVYSCDYYPGDDGEMVQDLLQTFDFEYTPGFTLQELKWNGEEFVIQ